MINKTRIYLYSLLEGTLLFSKLGQYINKFFITLIILNVLAIIFDSDPLYHKKYEFIFVNFELFSIVIFSLEYLARVFIAIEKPNPKNLSNFRLRLNYIFTFMGLIDLMAILPFYLSAFTSIDLRFMRLLRILRLLKLSHYFKGLTIFVTVLQKEAMSIGSAVFAMMVMVIVSASIMYNLEHLAQPQAFSSISDAIWWSVVTMTTVGYGDVTPVTMGGKLLATFIMLLGIGVVALPAGILAARFGDEIQSRKKLLTAHVAKALDDGYISSLEEHELEILRKNLDLSEEDLQRIVDSHLLSRQPLDSCPHCHKSLHTLRRAAD